MNREAEERRLRQQCTQEKSDLADRIHNLEQELKVVTEERDAALFELDTARQPEVTSGPFLRTDLPRYTR